MSWIDKCHDIDTAFVKRLESQSAHRDLNFKKGSVKRSLTLFMSWGVVTIVGMPTSVMVSVWSGGEQWIFSDTLCRIESAIVSTFQHATLVFAASIAVDRAAALLTPVLYSNKIQRTYSILVPLISSMLLAFPHLTWVNMYNGDSFHFSESKLNCCVNFNSPNYHSAVQLINVLSLSLPLSILLVSYLLITVATLKYQFSLRRQKDVRQGDEDFNFLSMREAQLSYYNLKIVRKSSLIVATTFSIFVAPYFISDMMASLHVQVTFSLRRASIVLFFISIGVNPILYGYLNKKTRKCLGKIVQNCIPDPDFQGANIEEESDTRSIGGYPIPKITPINETSFHHNHVFNPQSLNGTIENYIAFGTYEDIVVVRGNEQCVDNGVVPVTGELNTASAQISSLPTECSLVTLMTSIEGDEEFLTATIHSPVMPEASLRRGHPTIGGDFQNSLSEKREEDSYDKYIDEDSF